MQQHKRCHSQTSSVETVINLEELLTEILVINLEELLTEILVRVPALPLLLFKRVSKHWRSLISNPEFHLRHTRHNPRPSLSAVFPPHNLISPRWNPLNVIENEHGHVDIVSSCNGLLLCRASSALYFVLNPTTNRFLKLDIPKAQGFSNIWASLAKRNEVIKVSNERDEIIKECKRDERIKCLRYCAALGGLGLLETTYLTFLKLTNSEALCLATSSGTGSCGDILTSQYAVVFGVPLPLVGMAAYGLVAAFGVQKGLPFGVVKSEVELVLVGITTSMAAASVCFLYVLNTQFPGTLCPYCLLSAFLSFSLFFVSLKEIGFEKVLKEASLLVYVAVLVAVKLNRSYSSAPVSSSLADIDLPYVATEITTPSPPFAISLAKHLKAIGAKMYGAFWCSHCVEQKQMFGREAVKELNYVECFPGGYRKGTIMANECIDAKLEGFPTWVINGQVVSGEKDLLELAEASGFEMTEFSSTLVE